MDANDLLRLDYEQTNSYFKMLADIRFKLLAFVPSVTGIAVAMVSQTKNVEISVAVGMIGLVVTFGVVIYDLRNTQLYNAAVHRAKWLEVKLGMPMLSKGPGPGGLFNERPGHARLLWKLELWHDLGQAIVYSSAMGGWIYLIAESTSPYLGLGTPIPAALLAIILASSFGRLYLLWGGKDKPKPTGEMVELLARSKATPAGSS